MRLVKTIGDAAMLASPEPEPLLDAALDLIDAADAEGEDFPQLRAGAALGQALPRAGDWFGRPGQPRQPHHRDRAARAACSSSASCASASTSAYRWSFAGERRLKGIRGPVPLFRARREDAAPA